MVQIVKTRREAAEDGDMTYWTGRPCKHGHEDGRYTSGGMCIGCLKQQAKDIQTKRNDRNNMKFSGLQAKEVWVKKQYHDTVSDYAHILRYGTDVQISVVQSFIATIKEDVK